MSNTLKVLYFGKVAEICGNYAYEYPWVKDTDTFIKQWESQFPMIKSVPYRISVNRKLISNNIALFAGDEIAVMPPFSGG